MKTAVKVGKNNKNHDVQTIFQNQEFVFFLSFYRGSELRMKKHNRKNLENHASTMKATENKKQFQTIFQNQEFVGFLGFCSGFDLLAMKNIVNTKKNSRILKFPK